MMARGVPQIAFSCLAIGGLDDLSDGVILHIVAPRARNAVEGFHGNVAQGGMTRVVTACGGHRAGETGGPGPEISEYRTSPVSNVNHVPRMDHRRWWRCW